jgi:hypothetical protein
MVGLGNAYAGVLRAKPQRGLPLFRLLRLVQRIGAEPQQNRLDDRGVIEQGARYRARLQPRRDDDRWHAHTVPAEHRGLIVSGLGGRHVIVEAAIFVVDHDQQRTVPLGAGRERVVDGENEVLAVCDVGWWMVVVDGEAERVELVNAGSIQDSDRSVPLAASSRKLAICGLTVRSKMVFHGRPVLLK